LGLQILLVSTATGTMLLSEGETVSESGYDTDYDFCSKWE